MAILGSKCAELDVLNLCPLPRKMTHGYGGQPTIMTFHVWIPFQHILCRWFWRKFKYNSQIVREKWPVVFMCHRKYRIDRAHFCGFKSIIWQVPYFSWSTPDIFQKVHQTSQKEDNKSIRAYLNWQEGVAKICTNYVLFPGDIRCLQGLASYFKTLLLKLP